MDPNNWQILLDILTRQSQHRLQNIKNADPVSFCLDNKDIREVLNKYINEFLDFRNSHRKVKDAKVSEQKRIKGNKEFECKNFEKSLSLYTESVFYAPNNSQCLPLALANRSSVLYHLNKYEESIKDIELALFHGYPVSDSAKLMLRMGKCLVCLGKPKGAELIFIETLNNIENRCKNNMESYKKQLNEEIAQVSKIKDEGTSDKIFTLPELKDGENSNFAFASNALDLIYTKTKGRHVVAKTDIKIGDVLFVEKPFALVALKDVCYNCCIETIAPVPCWNCFDVKYCSADCRQKSWEKTHKYECGFIEFLKSVGIAHLGLRVALSAAPTFNSFKKILKKLKNKPVILDENNSLELKAVGYENVYNLVTHISDLEAQDLFQYAATASLLSLYVQQHTNYFPSQDEKNLKQFTSVVLRHICQLVCNGHAITAIMTTGDDRNMVVSQFQERIGTAIYPSASMMNHSCDPSIINSFYKDCLIVRACKDIKKGGEIFNCYGPHCRRMKRSERQEILLHQYHFKCECPACIFVVDIQDIFTALKCSKCRGPLIHLSSEAIELLDVIKRSNKPQSEKQPKAKQTKLCMECGEYETISKDSQKKETEMQKLLREGDHLLMVEGNIPLALEKVLKSWKIGREIFYKQHKHLSLAADLVAKCLMMLGDYRRSVMFLKCTVLSVESQFGSNSFEVATELKKLGDVMKVYVSSNKFREENNTENDFRDMIKAATKTYERAESIYALLCGLHHPCVAEIKDDLNFLKTLKY